MSKKLTRLQIEEIVRNMLAKHLLEGNKKQKGAMQTEGSGDRNDDREQGHGKQRQRAASDGGPGELEEIFHACATHVKENRTGREGRPINHTLMEDGTVTHYDVEFVNEIVTGIPVSALTILQENEHLHKAKRDDYPHGDKTRLKHMKEDAGEDGVEGTADDIGGLPPPPRRSRAQQTQQTELPPAPMPQVGDTSGLQDPGPKPKPMPSPDDSLIPPAPMPRVDEGKSDKEWYGDSLYGRLLKEWTKK